MKLIVLGAILIFWVFIAAVFVSGFDAAGDTPDALPSGVEWSVEEVSSHSKADDCWLIIGAIVYDVTGYISQHPAPSNVITDVCGTDATEAFDTKNHGRPHSAAAWRQLDEYLVGKIERSANRIRTLDQADTTST